MVDDTRNCDEVGAYLQKICPELQDAVLVIHTKANGEISEASSGKSKEELKLCASNRTKSTLGSRPYKAIVSVLMLKEGWDVRNVTVIVGLRAYSAKSNILPGADAWARFAAHVFRHEQRETVSVMGTPAFMEFVESIQSEGVTLRACRRWAAKAARATRFPCRRSRRRGLDKDLDALDIALPRLSRRFNREFKDLDELDPPPSATPSCR